MNSFKKKISTFHLSSSKKRRLRLLDDGRRFQIEWQLLSSTSGIRRVVNRIQQKMEGKQKFLIARREPDD